MGLHISGQVLGVTSETVHSDTGAFADFIATSVHLLEGVRADEVRVGKNFDRATLATIKKGDLVDFEVSIYKGNFYADRLAERVPAEQQKAS